MRGLWGDVSLNCEGTTEKLLVDHLLKDGSQLEEDTPGQ